MYLQTTNHVQSEPLVWSMRSDGRGQKEKRKKKTSGHSSLLHLLFGHLKRKQRKKNISFLSCFWSFTQIDDLFHTRTNRSALASTQNRRVLVFGWWANEGMICLKRSMLHPESPDGTLQINSPVKLLVGTLNVSLSRTHLVKIYTFNKSFKETKTNNEAILLTGFVPQSSKNY